MGRISTPIINAALLLLVFMVRPAFGDETPLEKVSLQLQWKHQFEFAGFYAAKEKGFYADAGLDVELLEFDESRDTLNSVLNGDVEYGVGYSSLVAEFLKGKPVVLLANFLKRSPIAIAVHPDIQTPKDLAGKRVMGVGDTISDISLLTMLRSFGIGPEFFEVVPPAYSVQPFLDDEVHAMVIFITNELYEIERSGKAFKLFKPGNYGSEFYDVNLFTSAAEVESHPERARRFREASIKGWEYALAHPDEIIRVIKRKYDTQHKSVESLEFEAQQIANAAMVAAHPVGSVDPQRLRMMASDFVELGLLPENLPLRFEGFVFPETGGKIEFTPAERAFIRDRLVRAMTTTNWPPFAFAEGEPGKAVGIGYEFWKEIVDTAGLKSEIAYFESFYEELGRIEDKTMDVIYSAGQTPKRLRYSRFTEPYATFPIAVATSKEENFIPDVTGLVGRKVAVGRNFTAHKMMAEAYPQIDYIPVDDVRSGLQAVSEGKAFAFVDIMPVLSHSINRYGYTNLKISGDTGLKFDMRMMIRNDYPELVSIANKVIAAMSPEKKRDILSRWINVRYEQSADYSRLIPYAVGVAFLAFVVFAWLFFAKRQAENAERAIAAKSHALEQANAELQQTMRLLERSNADLEKFAQVSSHDLREPLRMVTSYLQLVERKYGPALDAEGREYIGYAVSGAKRMDALIMDLLQFSRVDSRGDVIRPTDSEAVLQEALDNLQAAIDEASAIVTYADLPTVMADRSQLTQLFQNLIENAVKYQAPGASPEIDVSAKVDGRQAVFAVRDNGIGIEPEFFERIFVIFQRLHGREEYSGTGVGLAICKRVVERHGGRIWVESTPGGGSTFFFTLLAAE